MSLYDEQKNIVICCKDNKCCKLVCKCTQCIENRMVLESKILCDTCEKNNVPMYIYTLEYETKKLVQIYGVDNLDKSMSLNICYQCSEVRDNCLRDNCLKVGNECDICGKSEILPKYYNSISSDNGVFMCDNCASAECCQGCGFESGGSLCKYCRSDSNSY